MDKQAEIQELLDEFAFFDDWEDRYRHLIDLGKSLPPLSETEQTDTAIVPGCSSRVWMVMDTQAGAGRARTLRIRGDSESHIVKGLLAILARAYTGMTPDEARAFDAPGLFVTLGLKEHLTQQRANGLAAMIARIRAGADTLAPST